MINTKQGPLSMMQPIVSTSLSFLVFKLNGRGIKIKKKIFLFSKTSELSCGVSATENHGLEVQG